MSCIFLIILRKPKREAVQDLADALSCFPPGNRIPAVSRTAADSHCKTLILGPAPQGCLASPGMAYHSSPFLIYEGLCLKVIHHPACSPCPHRNGPPCIVRAGILVFRKQPVKTNGKSLLIIRGHLLGPEHGACITSGNNGFSRVEGTVKLPCRVTVHCAPVADFHKSRNRFIRIGGNEHLEGEDKIPVPADCLNLHGLTDCPSVHDFPALPHSGHTYVDLHVAHIRETSILFLSQNP